MTQSIVPQLVGKDFQLMRRVMLAFGLVSLAAIAAIALLLGHVPNWVMYNFGFILLVSPPATCGIVVLMKTNVFEKEKSTQPFIMSLPLTVKEFTRAKLLVNLPIFGTFWLAITAAGFYFAFGQHLFPQGAIPFVTMVFLGGFVAYTCILGTSLLFQSLGITILAITLFEMATSGYMYVIAYLDPIARNIWGPVAVWNTTAIAIVAAQALVAVSVIVATLLIQNTKRDFL